ncbi:hypothetical protein HY991_04845 [Candidatus Micrarchaeota archaeon]|nr:hypothetical protein [Candidatus Micrarchaeota archaeon]
MTPLEFVFLFIGTAFLDVIACFEFVRTREKLKEALERKSMERRKAGEVLAFPEAKIASVDYKLEKLANEIVSLRARMNTREFDNTGIRRELNVLSQELNALKETNSAQTSGMAVELERMKEKMGFET